MSFLRLKITNTYPNQLVNRNFQIPKTRFLNSFKLNIFMDKYSSQKQKKPYFGMKYL